MLYLREVLTLAKENVLLFFTMTFSVFALITLAHHKSDFESFFNLLNKQNGHPYFNALIGSDVNIQSISRKVYQLPGVVSIKEHKDESLKEEINKLEETFGQGLLAQLKANTYTRIKVELEKSLKVKSQKLVQEYLSRLVGEDKITLGNIREPRKLELKSEDPLMLLLKYSTEYLAAVLWSIYAFCFYLLMKNINAHAFIIEKFQRRSHVKYKIILSIVVFLCLLSFLGQGVIGFKNNLYLMSFIIYGLIFLTPLFLSVERRKVKI